MNLKRKKNKILQKEQIRTKHRQTLFYCKHLMKNNRIEHEYYNKYNQQVCAMVFCYKIFRPSDLVNHKF